MVHSLQAGSPDNNKLADSLAGKEATLIGITLQSGTFEEVKQKVGELGIMYPVAFGKDGIDDEFGGFPGFPTVFIVGKDWKIYRKYVGEVANKQELIKQDVDRLLSGDAGTAAD